ncbi:hypothetical protein LTR08_000320 [Meristemomyces frigidus]|nr:hypothetical protein LTR08_000320 [Meristemomyces frigidus]
MPSLRHLWLLLRKKCAKRRGRLLSKLSNTSPRVPHVREASANQPPGLHFLTLPPEIRNTIYDFALIDADFLHVTRDLKPPPLLATCAQIRRETLKTWYTRNNFVITIRDFDARVLLLWRFHCETLGISRFLTAISFSGEPDWRLMRMWVNTDRAMRRLRHERPGPSTGDAPKRFATACYELLEAGGEASWEALEVLLVYEARCGWV